MKRTFLLRKERKKQIAQELTEMGAKKEKKKKDTEELNNMGISVVNNQLKTKKPKKPKKSGISL